MKKFLIILFSLGYFNSFAQHDVYNWQVRGYAGIAHYYRSNQKAVDYLQPDNNMWYRLEVGHSLGKTFGLSASAALGKIRGLAPQEGYFTTEARMTSLKLYFYTDNGWLLKESSLVSPYFFGGYGLSTIKNAPNNDKYQQALPFGLGFKFRLADRWQLDFQTEAVYHTTSSSNELIPVQNKHNNSFLHTGVALAYNFGFKPSTFKASRFYTNFQSPTTPTVTPLNPAIVDSVNQLPDTTIAQLNTRSTALETPENLSENPRLVVIRDTVRVNESTYRQGSDTLSRTAVRREILDSISDVNRSRSIARTNKVNQDTVLTTAQEKAINAREKALAEYNRRASRAAALRQAETARTQEPLRTTSAYRTAPSSTRVYQPAPRVYRNSRPVTPISPSATVLLDNDRKELAEVNRKNLELRYAYDSLNAVRSRETQPGTQINEPNAAPYNSLNNRLMRYMQDQAMLNDSLKQRLDLYENELRRSPEVAAPTSPTADLARNENAFDNNVFFAKNSFEIQPLNFNNLLGWANYLKANPDQKVQLTGYADRTGKPAYNLELSRKRVEAVSEFLQYRGIAKERILKQYFGEENSQDPLVSLDRKVILNILE